MRRSLRWLKRIGLGVAVVLVIAVLALWLAARGSLPRLEGEAFVSSLTAPATIERDGNGLVTMTADNRSDLSRALGYVHAQERFFEMDLARRVAAGELSALFGRAALSVDRRHRVHRFRYRVADWWPALPAQQREQLTAYADGVNAGLSDLRVRPWPYLLLRQYPREWQPDDSLLVVLAMFFDLQDADNARERQLDIARRHLPASVFDFIVRAGTEWDAALAGDPFPEPPLPPVTDIDLRRWPPVPMDDNASPAIDMPGSNSFAVAGRLTTHGHALVANDMHLGLRVPNIWFRARLVYGNRDARVVLDGLTLPGVPALVVGSTGRIAWAFTNSYGDWLDFVRLRTDPANADRFLTADGWREYDRIEERIDIAGGESETLVVRETPWGPVVTNDDDGAPLALAWTAHQPGAVDAALIDLERAADVDAALSIVGRSGIPAQNFIVGDRNGRIAWTLAGRIPDRRSGHDASRPVDSAALSANGGLWRGWLDPASAPRIVDPDSGRLWTANARTVGGDALALLGDGGYDNGARARQIRDGLFAREAFDERALLAIQLDDRATFLARWWQLLRDVLASTPDDPALATLAAATASWDGCACIDSASYRLTRDFRNRVHTTLMHGLTAPIRDAVGGFSWPKLPQNEGVVWQLLRERPPHLLPPPHASWEALLVAQARDVVAIFENTSGKLSELTWGEANTVRIRHPLSAALPGFLGDALDMRPQPLPGDGQMPRVQGVQFGASERMVVAPGLEDQGLLHMPGGQSGHPLSTYYGAGHAAWAEGRAAPLVPDTTRWRLTLQPKPGAP